MIKYQPFIPLSTPHTFNITHIPFYHIFHHYNYMYVARHNRSTHPNYHYFIAYHLQISLKLIVTCDCNNTIKICYFFTLTCIFFHLYYISTNPQHSANQISCFFPQSCEKIDNFWLILCKIMFCSQSGANSES